MRQILFRSCDELELYDLLSSAQREPQRTRLSQLREAVSVAYECYGSATDVTGLDPASVGAGEDSEILRKNFSILRHGRHKLVGLRLMRGSSLCCLCGHRESSDLDHYLPKGRFPEFAAMTANLIPVCGKCNQKKSSVYRHGRGGPAFFHPYRHKLPNEQFLMAKLEIDSTTVSAQYGIIKTPLMDEEIFETLVFQFQRLGLGQLFGEQAASTLDERKTAIYEYYDDGGSAGVRKYLLREAKSAANFLGLNHWKPVLLNALGSSHNFCDGGFQVLGPPSDLT